MKTDDEIRQWWKKLLGEYDRLEWIVNENTIEKFLIWLDSPPVVHSVIKRNWVEAVLLTGEDMGYPNEDGQLVIDTETDHITIFEDGDISVEKKSNKFTPEEKKKNEVK